VTFVGKLDVHAHYLPRPIASCSSTPGHTRPDGMPQIPEWSAEAHVALMDRLGIATSLLSVSTPGVHFAPHASTAGRRPRRQRGRATRWWSTTPDGSGCWARCRCPDVEATLAEIAYCADELRVDGFILLTHVDGTYLGDPIWDPVFEELDRRHARVLVHPTSPVCWEHTSLGRPRPMLEFLFDTTRAVVNMVLNGTIARYPDVRLIIPHAGATLPVVADRVALFSLALGVDPSVDVVRDLGGLHFDLSGTPLPRQLDALLSLTSPDHLHYGSDYPFTPDFVAELATGQLDAAGDPAGSLAEMLRRNTLALFPNLVGER
jgi:predicted TIM-barrel fold metal-dependent hydrolase